MKKGIVLEQHRKYTVIMTKDGEFRKIDPVRDAEIGMEITFNDEPKKATIYLSENDPCCPSIAMAATLFFILLPFFPNQQQIYAYVVLDINPSVELEVTEDLKVNAVRPINEDAELLLKQLDEPTDKAFDVVMDDIIETSEEQGMINEDKHMLVGVSYVEETNNDDLPSSIEQYAKTRPEWKIATFHVPLEVRNEAIETNTSMNEILASKLSEEPEVEENLGEQEKEIIHSFYNLDEETEEVTEANEQSSTEETETKVPVEPKQPMEEPVENVPKQHNEQVKHESNNRDSESSVSNEQIEQKQEVKPVEESNPSTQEPLEQEQKQETEPNIEPDLSEEE